MNAQASHNNYWFRFLCLTEWKSVYVAEQSNAKAKANYFQHSSENHSISTQSLIVLLYSGNYQVLNYYYVILYIFLTGGKKKGSEKMTNKW